MPIPAGLGSPELPDWAPTNEAVADYVPHRTLSRSLITTTSGEDRYRYVFDDDTRPNGDQTSRLIGNAVAFITSRVSPLHASSEATCTALAALLTAVWIERSWPEDADALQRANDMEKQFNLMLTGLIASNDLANNPEDGGGGDGFDVVPIWSFPPADRRYDDARYF